jgi:hypothetical protein
LSWHDGLDTQATVLYSIEIYYYFIHYVRHRASPQQIAEGRDSGRDIWRVPMAIDVWALGCTIYQLLGAGGLFIGVSGTFANYIYWILYHSASGRGKECSAEVLERF